MRDWIFSFALGAAVAFLVALPFVVLLASADHESQPPLSERINAACPKGYTPTDWEVDGEFTSIPEGTAKVTCTAIALNREPHQIYRSVMTK